MSGDIFPLTLELCTNRIAWLASRFDRFGIGVKALVIQFKEGGLSPRARLDLFLEKRHGSCA